MKWYSQEYPDENKNKQKRPVMDVEKVQQGYLNMFISADTEMESDLFALSFYKVEFETLANREN